TTATLGTTVLTVSDSAVLVGGYHETGNIIFTLSGPGGFSYTQTDPVSGNGTYSASTTLPAAGTVAGTYTWLATYSGDGNNLAATGNGANEVTVMSALQLSAGSNSVAEGAGVVTYTVNRIDTTFGPVTVQFYTTDGTALSGTDYT